MTRRPPALFYTGEGLDKGPVYHVRVSVGDQTFYWAKPGVVGFFTPKKRDAARLPGPNADLVIGYLPSAMEPKRVKAK